MSPVLGALLEERSSVGRFRSLEAFPELSALSFSCCLSFSPVLEVRAGSWGAGWAGPRAGNQLEIFDV